ncbi:PAP2 superfamily-domain-containing protein [Xylariaceae sp. FL1651]|nr:PAP2 superfamily-domain-containing protein [Xylariaceae sp. FL1651]
MDRLPNKPHRPRSNSTTAAPSPVAPTHANCKTRRLSTICFQRDPYTMEKRPTFGQWIKVTWQDFLTILLVGAVTIPVYHMAPPLGTRLFPLDVQILLDQNPTDPSSATNSVVYPHFAYPARRQIISTWLITVIAIGLPAVIILLMQIRIRSFWDANNALLGFTYALLVSAAFQATVKALIGGLRPKFYDICTPDRAHAVGKGDTTGLNGVGYHRYMWSKDVCTTTHDRKLRDAMQSFPSGHSTTMMAAALYLCLYLNAKLKVFANYHTPLWKLVVLALPLLATVLLCGTLIIDSSHNWYDIAGGMTIGMIFALAAFRMVYASIFDWRVNHIPLHRTVPFDGYSRPDMVATNRAGWQSPVKDEKNDTTPPMPGAGLDGHIGETVLGPSISNQRAL